MLNLLQILLTEFKEQFEAVKLATPRFAQFSTMANKIKVAMGMRRTGKSYFLFQTIRHLIEEQQIPFERFLFLNFEDDRLAPCSQEQLVTLLDDFYKLYPENHDHRCYLFLDEIQNVEGWPIVIRRFHDSKKLQIYLTGSSAKLLSKEIASSLRGRSMATEIWPFSFSEYLLAHNIQWKKGLLGQKTRDVLTKHLQHYIDEGGFPESIGILPFERKQLLQDYVELVVMRDVVERYNINNITLIKYLIKTVLKNPGGNFSINKFANDIKSQGLLGVKNTILDYLRYLEDAYLVFFVPLFSESIKKTSMNPRKMYAIDTGLAKAFSFSFSNNLGHLFENMIYLDLRRQHSEVYYYLTQERYEVDFLAIDKLGSKCLFQVVWDVSNQETLGRELRALEIAKKELKLPGKLITPEDYIEAMFQNKLEELLS
jgi:hypothetical protein